MMAHDGSASLTLLTDFYELSMMQGYFLQKENPRVVFDMFFRRQPFGGGFAVFAGLEDVLRYIGSLSFRADDLAYLRSLGSFRPEFLDYLEGFRFTGDLWAMDEGMLAFPGEPLVRVHASLMEAQLIESALLAIINFQTLIATKSARVCLAANGGTVIEFGLRRAQGIDGALSASRAAYIGGAAATSNTLAGKHFGMPVRGTMAHSWVMAFESERESFEKYAETYPDGALLLIDTYDTLGSGIENAIAVGRKLKDAGHGNFGVRLDSGDLEYLSKKVRERLDEAGLEDARIVASNELDEHIIDQLITRGAPIDIWGVGTNLVTAGGDPALTGVYKISAREKDGLYVPTIKVSNNPEKTTNPGVKQVWRFTNGGGSPIADLICLADEEPDPRRPYTFNHPSGDYRKFVLSDYARITPLLGIRMKAGSIVGELPAIAAIRSRACEEIDRLDDTYKRLINPHVYKVSLSNRLNELKTRLVKESLSQGRHQ
ncbi:MAG TPA: nicotinate phosphoribosyltransferase [Spirochaetia bacterium]|nr:nicotinate phosphoribosyltransferase [Spirochaetia bacterium]